MSKRLNGVMNEQPETIPVDRAVRRKWLIILGLYLLVLVWLEPLIDWVLGQLLFEPSHHGIENLNRQKLWVATLAFALLRSLPLLLFLWLGWQIVHTLHLPPKGLRLPMTVRVIKGPKARLVGMVMMAVAMLSLLRELLVVANV